ncbi:MAG: alpha-galactosidase [Clostridia bacterium]|nr:alpha-galactosidase [Clostridia bacterium]
MIILSKFSAFAQKAVNSVKFNNPIGEIYDNSVALTPPMGWSSWNLFRNKINEDLIYETAEALKDSGLADCGYKYVNIDDCWQSSMRDKNGRLQGDLSSFPNGIKNLAERVNSLGLKLGIYSSNGTLTCEDLPASLGKEAIDADTFAEWGIEYFKYDFCHNIPISTSAPKIGGITVTDTKTYEETEYNIDSAVLSGEAEIINDKHLRYISGLSSNSGACEFKNIYVRESGEYILTIIVRKSGRNEKHLDILVNGTDIYRTDLPGTKSPTPDGKHQIKIKLSEGENNVKLYNSVASRRDSAAVQYSVMGKELKRATKEYAEKNGCEEKPIVFSICEWGRNFPWQWGSKAGNLWRTTPDILPKWFSVLGIYEFNVMLYKYSGIGSWNDPDMLEVGNGNLTYEENKSHFTLWCMMAAPLILGNDVRKFIKSDGSVDINNPTYKILSNKKLIAVNQDKLGIQCRRVKTNGAEDILVKPLENGEFAVCLFNKAGSLARMECSLKELSSHPFVGVYSSNEFEINELWSDDILSVSDKLETTVPPHGVKIYRVKVM